jgi:hypothetical protein
MNAESDDTDINVNWTEPPPSALVQRAEAIGFTASPIYDGDRFDSKAFETASAVLTGHRSKALVPEEVEATSR